MNRTRHLRSRLQRALVNPWAMLLSGIVLVISLDSLPPWSPARDSRAARLRDRVIYGLSAAAVGNDTRWGTSLVVRRREIGFEVMFPDEDSWGDAASALATAPESTVLFAFEGSASYSGLWGLTRYEESLALEEVFAADGSGPHAWASENRPMLRAVAVEALEQREFITPRQAESLRVRDSQERSASWAGWVHNALTVTALLVFCLSLGWIATAKRSLARRRAARELAKGRCPSCGYSVVGVEGDFCPECGERIVPAEGQRPPARS